MHKLLRVLVLVASASAPGQASTADFRLAFVADSGSTVVLAGGMGGTTGGGMGGGGMGGGGMGMGGMTGGRMGGMSGEMGVGTGYGFWPAPALGPTDGGTDPSGGAQPPQYYLCVTPYDRCSLTASPGTLGSGSACTCSTGHRGKIK